jgi:hypothetical protein
LEKEKKKNEKKEKKKEQEEEVVEGKRAAEIMVGKKNHELSVS